MSMKRKDRESASAEVMTSSGKTGVVWYLNLL